MNRRKGYALLLAIAAVNVFAIMALMARSMWETEIQRDLEEELLFRARQYKTAIELYVKKNNNLYPLNFNDLYEKNFLRKLYKDPMNEEAKWNIVMIGALDGRGDLLIVPEDMLAQYINTSRIVGVCSTVEKEGFKVYRGKKKYSEWAVYVGEQPDKEMPKLKFVGKPGYEESDESSEPGEKNESGEAKGVPRGGPDPGETKGVPENSRSSGGTKPLRQ